MKLYRQVIRKLLKFAPANIRMRSPEKASNRDFLLAQMPKNSCCAEIGVWRGDFSERILKITEPKKLHLIDPWQFQGDNFPETWYGGKKAQNQKDMNKNYNYIVNKFKNRDNVEINRGLSEDVLQQFDDGYFDWVYIDGNHFYEFVKKDFELSFLKVKKDGIIAGDNYFWKSKKDLDYSVERAVDEFVKIKHFSAVKIQGGQYILTK